MLYIKIQPQSILGEEDFCGFLPYMSMTAILVNKAKPFEQIVSIITTEGEKKQKVSEKMTFKIYTIFYIHKALGKGQIPPGDKILIANTSFTTLILHCKFQPFVFNTFLENDFSTFYLGTQVWPCHRKVKDHPRIIIWTNMSDLESQMLYTLRFSLKVFLVLKKKIFKCWWPSCLMVWNHFNKL